MSTGLPPGEPASGVLYESTPGRPGIYRRRDLGLALLLRDGKVAGIGLSRSAGARLRQLPRFDPNSKNPFQVDLRGANLSSLDLRERAADLQQAVFDTRTTWPPRERLPEGFDAGRILETGKNPGLGVRRLHKRGITGKGAGVALVDNLILASHQEFGGHVRLHEHINASPIGDPDMHGSTVVSIAAGQTLGVAPEADLYLISCWAHAGGALDLTARAKAFERVLEINRKLPAVKRIRVISMSLGWTPQDKGAAEMEAAALKAKQEGLLVITSSGELASRRGRYRDAAGADVQPYGSGTGFE
ncbi:MAG TPA: S8 family serine peptidase [Bryobacteraceae bacterium]|nr:S8 family serine peptidase [Bryobacteraceae bacterium]